MLLDDVKSALRISASTATFDTEVTDLIEAAKSDLVLTGVDQAKVDAPDSLVKRAITVYCKANFGWNNPDAQLLHESYESLKMHLSMSADYTPAPEAVV